MRRYVAIAATAAIAAVLFLTGCAGDKTPDDRVIVVGSGLAGHAAAYAALDNGAEVLWLEKKEELGGSSVLATGTFSAAGTDLQEKKGIKDSVELFMKDVNRIGNHEANQELLELYATKADDVWEWFRDNGLEPSKRSPFIDPVHSAYSVPRTYTPAKNSAFEYCRVMRKKMEQHEKNLTIKTSTLVTELIEEDGAVVGVRVQGQEGKREYRGDAVVLATGGFGSNFEMIAERMPKYSELRTVTMPHAKGDGILMAEEVGAQLVHMDYMVPYFGAIAQKNTKRAGFGSLTSGFAERWKGDIWLDLNGNRFVNEDGSDEDIREEALNRVPEQTAIIIFDQAAVKRNGGAVPIRDFDSWLEKDFGVKKRDSIEALATAFDIPVDSVLKTVEQVNRLAERNMEGKFGKKEHFPVSTPPFYGIKSYGTIFMTQGGVKTNTSMEVISQDNDVIPGLYAAGEVQGTAQWGGHGYSGGSGNAPAIIFGFEAGRHAAAATGK